MHDTNTKYTARDQAAAQFAGIQAMMAALECDYSRLAELKDDREGLADTANEAQEERMAAIDARVGDVDTWHALATANEELAAWDTENGEELAELKAAAGDCENEEEARERIQEDPLSVQVRSDWENPGETLTACEFQILLCTGGPAVRIMGELSQHGEPERAWLEYQDWGTPWTEYYIPNSGALVAYASCFYFNV